MTVLCVFRTMIKQCIKKTFPKTFIQARDIKDQFLIEYNTLRRVGIKRIFRQFLKSKPVWQKILPLQKFYTEECFIDLKDFDAEGAHAIYLSPSKWRTSKLSHLQERYPENCGLKITKYPGGMDGSFSDPSKTGQSHAQFSPAHRALVLIHNLFDSLGIGPKLYDVFEIKNQDKRYVAYAIEHIAGSTPEQNMCKTFIENLKNLEKQNLVNLIFWTGYTGSDFNCPDCNGNLIFDHVTKSLKYIDLQHFGLGDYTKYLESVACKAASASHFGPKSYLMGGQYLYQEIPGLNKGGMRSPEVRFKVIQSTLQKASLSLKDKLVIDIGCNLGVMGAYYLNEGAFWLHGIDMPPVIESAHHVLRALGCTRFSLTGITLEKETNIRSFLPSHLKTEGCIISYLAVRNLLGGWLEDLAHIPWSFMIYESHQGEDRATNYAFFEELNRLKRCEVIAESTDIDSSYVALVKAL